MKEEFNIQQLLIQTAKLIGVWFAISSIFTFLGCLNNSNSFCVFGFLHIVGQPVIMFLDVSITLGLSDILSRRIDTSYWILFVLWFLSWMGMAWIYLKIKNNLSYFRPTTQKVMLFMILLLLFSPFSFSCGKTFDDTVDDQKYCPATSSSSSSTKVSCTDPNFNVSPDKNGNCYSTTSSVSYNCLLCKYPRYGIDIYKFRKPGSYDLEFNFYFFSFFLVTIEYLFSCFLHRVCSKKFSQRKLDVIITLIMSCLILSHVSWFLVTTS